MTESAPKRLYRSETDRRIAGLCGGLAEYFNWDPTLVRLGAVVVAVVSGFLPMVVAYLVGILIVPIEPVRARTQD
jgi:phage shock protein PspC (stress-responsive transcriptional regulator)